MHILSCGLLTMVGGVSAIVFLLLSPLRFLDMVGLLSSPSSCCFSLLRFFTDVCVCVCVCLGGGTRPLRQNHKTGAPRHLPSTENKTHMMTMVFFGLMKIHIFGPFPLCPSHAFSSACASKGCTCTRVEGVSSGILRGLIRKSNPAPATCNSQ